MFFLSSDPFTSTTPSRLPSSWPASAHMLWFELLTGQEKGVNCVRFRSLRFNYKKYKCPDNWAVSTEVDSSGFWDSLL